MRLYDFPSVSEIKQLGLLQKPQNTIQSKYSLLLRSSIFHPIKISWQITLPSM